MTFPDGARFAFTIIDDTDDTTTENGPPVYSLLHQLGLRTTKTVWALDTPAALQGPYFAGETLQDPSYLAWVRELHSQGFEIAFHNASMGSSFREKTIEALDLLNEEFPGQPRVHCNHGQNLENLYWGEARYSLLIPSLAARVHALLARRATPEGHVPDSSYYWGDVARDRLAYVRAFSFVRLNCAHITPGRPFFDPRKPLVSRWFNTADAPDAGAFSQLVNRRSVDKLVDEGGWAIVSTHFGKGFSSDGEVDGEVAEILQYIAALPGWFVPAGELLDHLWDRLGNHTLRRTERYRMEFGHLTDRALRRN